MKKIITTLIIVLIIIGCKSKNAFEEQPRDETITPQNAIHTLFMDSVSMEDYFASQNLHSDLSTRIRSFYNSRNYQFAWFDSTGLVEYAGNFLSLQSQYISYSKDSGLYNPFLSQLQDSLLADSTSSFTIKPSEFLHTELKLTEGFFRYALHAYQGDSTLNAQDLGWFIPRKKVDLTALLDSMITHKGKNLEQYEPVNQQYNLLKEKLLKYYAYEKSGGWDSIHLDKKFYKVGDSSAVIAQIKERLIFTKDYNGDVLDGRFDSTLRTAIKNFQRRYGLKEDGAIGTAFMSELNRPIQFRIQQLLINMERLRWIPDRFPPNYFLANIPAYKLMVYENNELAWDMNVVVGATAHSTVIFQGDMKYVVFSPYWYVPPGILKSEINPGMKRDPNYLAKRNMEWNGGSVRQKPGPNNSLGLVKFLFPNSYNIYFHDTPSKSLFGETNRAFSHGCIRLSEPAKLANYILRDHPFWNEKRIDSAMHSGKEKYVVLEPTIPVYIGYFTAWVDGSSGELHFRNDVYGHDKKMAEKMFFKSIAK